MAATNFDAYGPEDDVTYDATGDDDGSWGTFRLIGVLVLLAAFLGFVYLAYVQGLRNGKEGTPLITADSDPYKTQPENPGGQTFAETQTKAINDRVTGTETDITTAEAQAPPETPINLAEASAQGGPSETQQIASLEVEERPLVTGATPSPQRRPSGITAATTPRAEADPAPAQSATQDDKQDIASLVEPPQQTQALAATNVAPTSGAYVLQLASFPERGLAEEAWKRVSAKHGDLIVGLGPDYQSAEIPGKGTYHRLRIGPFRSKAEAAEVCSALKARKQDCIPKKN